MIEAKYLTDMRLGRVFRSLEEEIKQAVLDLLIEEGRW
jgi:hypothetical protein